MQTKSQAGVNSSQQVGKLRQIVLLFYNLMV